MTSIPKPKVRHPGLPVNAVGLTRRDYEGVMSTLCAGCGHDSITAAVVRAFWELNIEPHKVGKLSGIGCSSKTPAYFLKEAHGFNAVHGRMPSIGTGASAANRDLMLIGVSGDGDSLSIGLGQFCHAIRRNLNVLYILENNGVYGLTKGQFSASADMGSKPKKGEPNRQPPIDPVLLALTLGATFVARSFSGDKEQLVPIIQAGLAHKGFAFIDVISPCVTFNDHEGSTKSYQFTRQRAREVVSADLVIDHDEPTASDLVPLRAEISAAYAPGTTLDVTVHDGTVVRLRKIEPDYDPTDRDRAYAYVRASQTRGEVATGLLYLATGAPDMHDVENSVDRPLVQIPYEELCPGSAALTDLMEEFR
jgi:2-oxoglutarate/2-oxoacid ferredoxin oxidoreductase subunit beta